MKCVPKPLMENSPLTLSLLRMKDITCARLKLLLSTETQKRCMSRQKFGQREVLVREYVAFICVPTCLLLSTFLLISPAPLNTELQITKEPRSYAVREGGQLSLSCEAKQTAGNEAPLNYQWYHNGRAIAEATSSHYKM